MKKTLFSIGALCASIISFSQIIVPSNGHIFTYGAIPGLSAPNYHNYSFVHRGSMLLVGTPSIPYSQFLQFDVWNGRIATTGNWLVLYNTQTSTFNDLAVGTVYNYSDARAKTNVKTINYGLSTLNKLRPVSYSLTNNPSGQNDHRELGLIAQELEQIMPELVRTDKDGKKLVNYIGLLPVLIKSIQELQKEVAALKAAK